MTVFSRSTLPGFDLNTYLAAGTSAAWNGPICPTCHRGYIGAHTCNPDDLRAIVARLEAKIAELETHR